MKTTLQFGDQEIEADVSKEGLLAVHRSLDPAECKRGYVITHVPSLRIVAWIRLKSEAVRWRKELEDCDWDSTGYGVRLCLKKLREA